MGSSSKLADFWVPLFTNQAIWPKHALNSVNFSNSFGYPFCRIVKNNPKRKYIAATTSIRLKSRQASGQAAKPPGAQAARRLA